MVLCVGVAGRGFVVYAIIRSGGKQYKVGVGDVVSVELIRGVEVSGSVTFRDVLFVHDGEGGYVTGSDAANHVVSGEIVGQVKGPKVIAFKYKRRKGYRRKVGHRQKYLQVKIATIGSRKEG
ncbi:MAG: 50S ribosomal protein L21 [Simkaniaceae bacterium]|nr:50S ribosomal protein L21 [Simkaniaceae bacterium]